MQSYTFSNFETYLVARIVRANPNLFPIPDAYDADGVEEFRIALSSDPVIRDRIIREFFDRIDYEELSLLAKR